MSNRIHALAQQLTGKKSIEECSIDELRHMAKRHPYFAPAQFLLLQKLRQSGTPEEAEAQYRKAVLFFHDPLLFEQFISSNKFYVDGLGMMSEAPVQPEIIQEQQKEETLVEVEAAESQPVVIGDPLEAVDLQEEETETDIESESVASQQEEKNFADDKAAWGSTANPPPEDIVNEPIENAVEEAIPAPVKEETALPELQTKEPPATTELAFEPFHTVDYFASQGIKITQEEVPKDKLGKQLKSFTQWLKTMKRLPATQITETVETSAEKKVETLASHSVSESSVVTEAMAEVWLKQGNAKKALDIYNKLSLQNPSKKAYFAAKIENLKQS
jgi:hypothetical protein